MGLHIFIQASKQVIYNKYYKGKGVSNRPDVAQRVPGGLGSQIS